MIASSYFEDWSEKQCEKSAKVNTLKETARSVFKYTIRRFVCTTNERLEKKTGNPTDWKVRLTEEMARALPDVVTLVTEGDRARAMAATAEYVSGFEFFVEEPEKRCARELARLEEIIG
jgi:hypothetical protein